MKTVQHDVLTVERQFNAQVDRVFTAWADAGALKRWYLPGGDGWQAEVLEHDFQVGGRKHVSFGPQGEEPYEEDCRYEDIVKNERIIYTMTVSAAGKRITASLVTVEFSETGQQTNLRVTEQMAILDGGDSSEDRETGWGEVLDKLAIETG